MIVTIEDVKKITRSILDTFLVIWCGSALFLNILTLSGYFVFPVGMIIKGEAGIITWVVIMHTITGIGYLYYEENKKGW